MEIHFGKLLHEVKGVGQHRRQRRASALQPLHDCKPTDSIQEIQEMNGKTVVCKDPDAVDFFARVPEMEALVDDIAELQRRMRGENGTRITVSETTHGGQVYPLIKIHSFDQFS